MSKTLFYILMVYMVKHGFGDTATVMTERNRKALKDTFDALRQMLSLF